MFFILFTCIMGVILIILLLLGFSDKPNIASKEIMQIIQKCEIDRDKDDETLSDMIKYHKERPIIRYKI